METKNTPLLFQQELNQYYKDILNCEVTHPSYWDGKVPETFFLRRRKGIELYHDWGGDEVLDYINFDGEEYGLVRFDNNIRVMKWNTSSNIPSIDKLINLGRALQPTWLEKDFEGTIGDFNIVSYVLNKGSSSIFFFSVADRTYNNVTTKELFVTEYKLLSPGNIDYSVEGKTYWVKGLSGLIDSSNIAVTISNSGKSLFLSKSSTRKIYQIKLQKDWDMTSFYSDYLESSSLIPKSMQDIKSLYIPYMGDRLYFVSNTYKVGCITFDYNNISSNNSITYVGTQKDRQYTGVSVSHDGSRLYLAADGKIFDYYLSTSFDLTTIPDTYGYIEVGDDKDLCQNIVTDYDGFNFYVLQDGNVIVQLGFSHATTLFEGGYNSSVNHSFKRNFQSVKGKLLYGNGEDSCCSGAYVSQAAVITDQWSTLGGESPERATNALAGAYISLIGHHTGSADSTGGGGGQIMQIISNTADTLTVGGWDTAPNITTYVIFEDYGEVLTFIGGDGLYAIHNDSYIDRYESLNKTSVSVADADWNNGRIFALLSNGSVVCSATLTSDSTSSTLDGGYFSGLFNQHSFIGNTVGGLRIVPFNDIVCVFTDSCIYVIKKEQITFTSSTESTMQEDVFTMSLSFDFVGLHSRKAIIPYNTGIYFISSKNTFLSLNIEENYYNKYKITTEDMGVDIQQWLDNIESDDDVSLGIDEDTIYVVWNSLDKSTIFQYDIYYNFWHRRETLLIIKGIRVDNNQTYLGPSCYRYNLNGKTYDEGNQEYKQHLRWFNGDTDIFSLKTILYHKMYLGKETNLNTSVKYKARLSTGTYEYNILLEDTLFLQKNSNIKGEGILGEGILGLKPLGGMAENKVSGEYVSEIDILEVPLGLTYSLLEITIEGDFEIGGNLLGTLVHDAHLTPYEDVVSYLDD